MDNFSQEYRDELMEIFEENKNVAQIKYFLRLTEKWHNRNKRQRTAPQIVLVGVGIPEELVIASGGNPYWILGGSLAACSWADGSLPRDTDPVSRSIFGFVHDKTGVDLSNTLFIIPSNCDSMRKIYGLLRKEGKNVFLVDVPPYKNNKIVQKKWIEQMTKMMEAIASFTGKRITKKSMNEAIKSVMGARIELLKFKKMCKDFPDAISNRGKLLIENSYYFTGTIQKWKEEVKALTSWMQRNSARFHKANVKPKVLLVGSPVYFPNYKVPKLLDEAGLVLLEKVDPLSIKNNNIYCFKQKHSLSSMIKRILNRFLEKDASSAFVSNSSFQDTVYKLIEDGEVNGVIFHVLKGQIEYDFELEIIEPVLEAAGIPCFIIETDYQYQDVEQLRIRLEAFSEMLYKNINNQLIEWGTAI